jgi:large subunit ribosomal protein L13
MKTYSAKPGDIKRDWFVIDAEGLVLGGSRRWSPAACAASHKPIFTPHGLRRTISSSSTPRRWCSPGNKRTEKTITATPAFPGGIKEITAD